MRVGPNFVFASSFAALLAMSSPSVAQQGTYVSVEGGFACTTGKTILEPAPGSKLGDDGCGGRGTIELGRTGVPVFAFFDHWAVRARISKSKDSESYIVAGSGVDASLTDKRFVFDAELGARLPFSPLGFLGLNGTTRATVGVRYVDWQGDTFAQGVSGPALGLTEQFTYDTSGWGARIGLRSNLVLNSHWMIESNSGLSLLDGRSKLRATINGVFAGEARTNGTVWSFDSSTMLSYKLNGSDNGPVLSAGIASDYYFNQIPEATDKVKRFSWGPVARIRIPLGQ
jgi:hypothetical protein